MRTLPRGWSSWLALGLLLVVAGLGVASTISKPFTFSPGSTISSSQMNSNFDTLYNWANGDVDSTNISSLLEAKVTFSATGHAHSGGTGGAPVQWVVGANITSAASLTVTVDGNFFTVAGSTGPITALSSRNSGVFVRLYFTGTPTLTYNATSLILLGAANYTVTAGDVLTFVSLGSGNWRQVAGPNMVIAATGVTFNRAAGGATIQALESGTWSDVSGSRAAATVYQNTSGKKRRASVVVNFAANAVNTGVEVGPANPPTLNINQQAFAGAAGTATTLYFEVPHTWYYRIPMTTGTINSWFELDE